MTAPDFAQFALVARPLLDLVHRLTGLESTFLTRIDWDTCQQEVVLALNTADLETVEGSVVDWVDTMCRVTFLDGREQLCDILTDYPVSTGAERGMCTFVSVPILKGDDALGTVCGASRRPVTVGPDMIANMRLIAAALSTQLEAHVERLSLRDRAEEAEALASVDALTGLANRRAFATRYEQELARSGRHGTPISVLAIDLDHFKAVNDNHGHPGGDRVLAAAADVLRRAARAEDVPARLGGDEFAVVMPHCGAAGAGTVAVRIADDFRAATAALGMPCTLSVGLASSDTGDRHSLLARADVALYRAKAALRDRAVTAVPPE